MSEFTNVTVVREANIYFNGGVTSHTILFPDGTKKTLGIMQPGEYEFTTGVAEVMEILSGTMKFRIEDGLWQDISGGRSFQVPANSRFSVRVETVSDYCCSFLG